MNRLLYIFLLISVISCQKQQIYHTNPSPSETTKNVLSNGVNRWGKFLLIGSTKYVTNTATDVKIYYNDFGNSKRSSLRWGGSLYIIENIVKDSTTWSFWSPQGVYGNFRLNNDSIHKYSVYYMYNYTSIIDDPNSGQQNIGGSKISINGQTLSLRDSTIQINVLGYNFYDTLGNYNEYITQLTFKKIKSW